MTSHVELLDQDHVPIVSLLSVAAQQFLEGQEIKLNPARLAALTQAVAAIWQARQSALPQGETSILPASHYLVRLAPDLQKHLDNHSAEFMRTNGNGQLTAQVRDRQTGRILGMAELVDPKTVMALTGSPHAALAVAALTSALMGLQAGFDAVQNRLDQLQGSVDALRAHLEAEALAKLQTALDNVRHARADLQEGLLSEAQRAAWHGKLEGSYGDCQNFIHKQQNLQGGPAQQTRTTPRRFPPLPRRGEPARDEVLPRLNRLLFGIATAMQVLSMLEQTGQPLGLKSRRQELLDDLNRVREQHLAYRKVWAVSPETARHYGVNIADQFEALERLDTLKDTFALLEVDRLESRALLLEVGEQGHIRRVALPALS